MGQSQGQLRTEAKSIRRSSSRGWVRGQSSTEPPRFSVNRPRAWARGQAMVEMGIVAPIVVAGLLMWAEIGTMTSTQHRLMAAAYDGVKVVSQFQDMYITNCTVPSFLKWNVAYKCLMLMSGKACAGYLRMPALLHAGDNSTQEGLTEAQKDELGESLRDLLDRKTVCQTVKDRTQESLAGWGLSPGASAPGGWGWGWWDHADSRTTVNFLHYYKDANGNEYDWYEDFPRGVVMREYVGVEIKYPKTYSLGHLFGITEHKARAVTLLSIFTTATDDDIFDRWLDTPCSYMTRTSDALKNLCN